MDLQQRDALHMAQALEAARRALTLSSPNPRVGCVLVSPAGEVIGVGHTQRVGGPHAEVMALRDAAARGAAVAGATAYVTLEPCAHHGRTPPCCDALITAGVGRVVASLQDPNPLVAGQGLARLEAAGVAVSVGEAADAARELNLGFLSRMQRGRPWVRMKVAASLDGRTALDNGTSQWITGPEARRDGHAWRARACAVLTGIGTVLQDNPMLDVREVPTERQPRLVVVDSRTELPLDARLLVPGRDITLYAAQPDPAKVAALQARGVKVVVLPDANGKVDLVAMLRDLAAREVNELHVEAGYKLNGSLLATGCVDELLLYMAPMLMDSGVGIAKLRGLEALADAPRWTLREVGPVGDDVRLLLRQPGADRF